MHPLLFVLSSALILIISTGCRYSDYLSCAHSRPSIPHLVYQYAMYTNFPPTKGLSEKNPEIPDDDD